jgi:hypothetical protein
MAQRSVDQVAIEVEIDRIRSLGLDALRQRWRATFGTTPPTGLSKDLIARTIAYRIQEAAIGRLDHQTSKLLDHLARGEKAGTELNRRLKSGTVLIREYQGERHTVTAIPDGFVWQGTTYSSLSTIARAITGTAWNGPRFFGLRGNGHTDQESNAKPAMAKRPSSPRRLGPSQSRKRAAEREVLR